MQLIFKLGPPNYNIFVNCYGGGGVGAWTIDVPMSTEGSGTPTMRPLIGYPVLSR